MRRSLLIFVSVLISTMFLSTSEALAARRGLGGSISLGGGLIYGTSDQKALDGFIDDQGVTGTKNLGSSLEYFLEFEYRFTGSMFALGFRPSYFTQSASGGGVEVNLTGITAFPLLRLYPLESDYLRLYFQVGVGYGNVTAKLSNSTGSGTYDGNTYGGMAGVGVQFCLTDSSCFSLEGNGRYLPIQPVTGSGNTLGGPGTSRTNGELERNNSDVAITLGGFQAALFYQFHF